MKYALVENDVVVRLLRVEPSTVFHQPEASRYEPCSDDVMEGWVRSGGGFVAPNPVPPVNSVPVAITMRQARLVLLGAGKLAGVDTAIANIPDPTTRAAAQIEWEFSNELQRDNAFVTMLAPALGLTSEQVDQLFIAGSVL